MLGEETLGASARFALLARARLARAGSDAVREHARRGALVEQHSARDLSIELVEQRQREGRLTSADGTFGALEQRDLRGERRVRRIQPSAWLCRARHGALSQ